MVFARICGFNLAYLSPVLRSRAIGSGGEWQDDDPSRRPSRANFAISEPPGISPRPYVDRKEMQRLADRYLKLLQILEDRNLFRGLMVNLESVPIALRIDRQGRYVIIANSST